MTNITHIIYIGLLAITSAVMLSSCANEEDLHTTIDQRPISFASIAEEQESETRADTPLGRDFVVYGYKSSDGQAQQVINGYTVQYLGTTHTSVDNTHGYSYVIGDQTLKYWDFAASEYHFWGVWAETTDLATFSGNEHNILTIKGVTVRTGEPDPTDDVLYSSLYDRYPVSADVVQLRFKHPYAKLRIQFYTTEPIEGDDHIELSAITFAPNPSAADPYKNKVYGKGDVKVTYPLPTDACNGAGKEVVTVENLTMPQESLRFANVELTASVGTSSNTAATAPIDDSDGFQLGDMPGSPLKAPATRAGEQPGRKYYYYPLPMGDLNPNFTMSVSINDELKTAVVPAAYMQWKPNYSYTYIFKITEAGKKMSFYDVKIDPWKFGGSMDEEFKNW